MSRSHGIARALMLVVAVVTVAAGYAGHIDPRHWAWPALLGLAYPAVAAGAAVLTVVWLLARQWRLAVVQGAALLLTWPSLAVNMPVHPFAQDLHAAPTSHDTLRIITFNVNAFNRGNWRVRNKPSLSLRYILDSGAQVVVLTQAPEHGAPHDSARSFSTMLQALDSIYPYRSHGSDDVLLFSRYPFERVEITPLQTGYDVLNYFKKVQHHYALAYDLQLPDGRQLRVVGTYLHSFGLNLNDRDVFNNVSAEEKEHDHGAKGMNRELWKMSITDKLLRAFRLRADESCILRAALDAGPPNLVLCGDFNDTPASFTYRTLRGDDLRDAYAETARWPARTFNRYSFAVHIDHVLYRGALRAVACEVPKRGDSDHYPVVATLVWDDKNETHHTK